MICRDLCGCLLTWNSDFAISRRYDHDKIMNRLVKINDAQSLFPGSVIRVDTVKKSLERESGNFVLETGRQRLESFASEHS